MMTGSVDAILSERHAFEALASESQVHAHIAWQT